MARLISAVVVSEIQGVLIASEAEQASLSLSSDFKPLNTEMILRFGTYSPGQTEEQSDQDLYCLQGSS